MADEEEYIELATDRHPFVKKEDILYSGVFVSIETINEVMERIVPGTKRLAKKVKMPHVVLSDGADNLLPEMVGMTVDIKVTGYAVAQTKGKNGTNTAKNEGLLVELASKSKSFDDDLKKLTKESRTVITISMTKNGVLKNTEEIKDWTILKEPINIKGKYGVYLKSEKEADYGSMILTNNVEASTRTSKRLEGIPDEKEMKEHELTSKSVSEEIVM